MDFDIGIVAVGFTGQQGLELFLRDLFLQAEQRAFGLRDNLLVLFRLAQLEQFDIVLQLLLEGLLARDLVVELLTRAHQRLGPLRIVPEIGVFDLDVQLGRVCPVPYPSQRCLLSSPNDRLISSTTV